MIFKHSAALIAVILFSILILFLPFHLTKYIVFTPENWHKNINFNIDDPGIDKIEVEVSARLVPYNFLTDYIGGLAISMNQCAVSVRFFDVNYLLCQYFKIKVGPANLLGENLWFSPKSGKLSAGLSGIRTIYFDKKSFKLGENKICIRTIDNQCPYFPSLGDVFIIKNIKITAYNEKKGKREVLFILNKN